MDFLNLLCRHKACLARKNEVNTVHLRWPYCLPDNWKNHSRPLQTCLLSSKHNASVGRLWGKISTTSLCFSFKSFWKPVILVTAVIKKGEMHFWEMQHHFCKECLWKLSIFSVKRKKKTMMKQDSPAQKVYSILYFTCNSFSNHRDITRSIFCNDKSWHCYECVALTLVKFRTVEIHFRLLGWHQITWMYKLH